MARDRRPPVKATPLKNPVYWVGMAVFLTGAFKVGADSLALAIWLMLCGGFLLYQAIK